MTKVSRFRRMSGSLGDMMAHPEGCLALGDGCQKTAPGLQVTVVTRVSRTCQLCHVCGPTPGPRCLYVCGEAVAVRNGRKEATKTSQPFAWRSPGSSKHSHTFQVMESLGVHIIGASSWGCATSQPSCHPRGILHISCLRPPSVATRSRRVEQQGARAPSFQAPAPQELEEAKKGDQWSPGQPGAPWSPKAPCRASSCFQSV
ncbi:hypothetical protein B0T22DRAFT_451301 [Podospora appendiculata]|uniref:Uncharacterized protein n=1 Tax=Podospora appendiculata TaxID=314037 RepID=A0AAE0XIM5_9PEZI|nr:hypothetical protein B0T22DRAFT_451301 [Podospora appendiculata]